MTTAVCDGLVVLCTAEIVVLAAFVEVDFEVNRFDVVNRVEVGVSKIAPTSS